MNGYIQHLWSDEETMRDVGGTHAMDDERAKRWFAGWIHLGSQDRRYFLIVRTEDDVPVGEACFFNFKGTSGTANYSMNIEAKYRGKGYAKEGIEVIVAVLLRRIRGTSNGG